MDAQWFRFSVPGAEDRYGHGTKAEAEEFAKLLGDASYARPLAGGATLGRTGVRFEIADALSRLRGVHRHAKRTFT